MTARRAARDAAHSCAACLAWGCLVGRGLCVACTMFARDHAAGECSGCGRVQPVRKRYCRLCWCQARTQARESGEPRHTAKAVHHLHRVRHHQLFFANMLSTRGAATTPPRTHDRRGRPRKSPPAPAGRPNTQWVQPFLFNGLHRDYTRFDEREDANLDNPWLGWGQHLAYRLGEAHGWSGGVRDGVQRALIILLSGHVEGDVVFYSAMSRALRALEHGCERTAEILDQMGILVDDRRPSFEDWLDGKLEGITPGITREVETWLRRLRDGGPRARPRNIATVWQYANALRPILLEWSTNYDSAARSRRPPEPAVG